MNEIKEGILELIEDINNSREPESVKMKMLKEIENRVHGLIMKAEITDILYSININ